MDLTFTRTGLELRSLTVEKDSESCVCLEIRDVSPFDVFDGLTEELKDDGVTVADKKSPMDDVDWWDEFFEQLLSHDQLGRMLRRLVQEELWARGECLGDGNGGT